jgi:ribokinase
MIGMPSSATSAFPDIVVIGSANMDLVVRAPQLPRAGETVLGGEFATIPGGKGANQAVAAAHMGGTVGFVGCVGDDAFGATLRTALCAAGVDVARLQITTAAPTGVALIIVSDAGENAICVAPGANATLSVADIDDAARWIQHARVLLVQLEIPLPAVCHAIALARRHGVEVILDPAPAPREVEPALFQVDILTPNQTEAAQLSGLGGQPPATVARELRRRGARDVVLKLGSAGAYVQSGAGECDIAGHAVGVVDTTAAGDAFSGALAAARAAGEDLVCAARVANAAGALACTKRGAQPSAPTRADVMALLAKPPPTDLPR